MPNLRSELLRTAAHGATVWVKWRWWGTWRDGTPLDIRGTILFGVRGERIAWGRLYMEETEATDVDIDATMRHLTAQSPGKDRRAGLAALVAADDRRG